MDIIALRGNSDVGKSETLNIVYQFMLLFGYIQAPPGPRHFRILGNRIQKDFIDILEKKGRRIGIATMGDYARGPESVANLLSYLDGQHCDKAICACNITLPGTVNAVTAYLNHQILDKTVTAVAAEQRIRNGEDAERIYRLI